MKLDLKNIAIIQNATIELDGITLLAGYNGTGKSTISKALYAIIRAYINLPGRIIAARNNSVHKIISTFIDQVQDGFFLEDNEAWEEISSLSQMFTKGEKAIPKQLVEFVQLCPKLFEEINCADAEEYFQPFISQLQEAIDRPSIKYAEYLVGDIIRNTFDGQINTIGGSPLGEIHLAHNTSGVYVKIEQNKVVECSESTIKENSPIYIEPRHLIDDFINDRRQYRMSRNTPLQRLLMSEGRNEPFNEKTIEEHEKRESVLALIDSVIHGGLVSTKNSLVYADKNYSEPISLKNVASGNKTVAVLKRLVENEAIHANSILIIDEPEMNLHPAWQLKLAEILVLLNCKLGVRVFLNTHSPYFCRAVEVFSGRYGVEEKCHYYKTVLSNEDANMFNVLDVTGRTEQIYHDLYMPFEEL